jgi:hypothetical protein
LQPRSLSAALATAGLLLPACQVSPISGPYGGPRRPCVQLANAFAALAETRDRGVSREQQIEIARARSPEEEDHAKLDQWLQMVDLVYRHSEAGPEEIGWTVLDHCSVDMNGRARVTTLWPGQPPR